MRKPTRKLSDQDAEFRRKWCIEQAIRWPTVQLPAVPGMDYRLGQIPNYPIQGQPERQVDIDLIGRAKKIEDYVRGDEK